MQEIFEKILEPYMNSMPELVVALMGLIGTLACIIPENSKLGKLLGLVTGTLSKLKNFLLRKKNK
tara:strand:+ start:1358 stop:1552 length:195 start_codon:yes stop_codon:yes gene_type:complete